MKGDARNQIRLVIKNLLKKTSREVNYYYHKKEWKHN